MSTGDGASIRNELQALDGIRLHRAVPLRAGKMVSYDIDLGIVPLVASLWELGFWTQFSCEGGEEGDGIEAYICFSGDVTAARVAELSGLPAVRLPWEDDFPVDSLKIETDERDERGFRSVLRWNPSLTTALTDSTLGLVARY